MRTQADRALAAADLFLVSGFNKNPERQDPQHESDNNKNVFYAQHAKIITKFILLATEFREQVGG